LLLSLGGKGQAAPAVTAGRTRGPAAIPPVTFYPPLLPVAFAKARTGGGAGPKKKMTAGHHSGRRAQ